MSMMSSSAVIQNDEMFSSNTNLLRIKFRQAHFHVAMSLCCLFCFVFLGMHACYEYYGHPFFWLVKIVFGCAIIS